MNEACKKLQFCFMAEKWLDGAVVCNPVMCANDFNPKVIAVYQNTPNNFLKGRIKDHFKF